MSIPFNKSDWPFLTVENWTGEMAAITDNISTPLSIDEQNVIKRWLSITGFVLRKENQYDSQAILHSAEVGYKAGFATAMQFLLTEPR